MKTKSVEIMKEGMMRIEKDRLGLQSRSTGADGVCGQDRAEKNGKVRVREGEREEGGGIGRSAGRKGGRQGGRRGDRAVKKGEGR